MEEKYCIYKLVERTQAELEWGRISKLTFSDSYNEALPVYEELEKVLVDDPYFLYNYAAVLLEKKQYNKSLEIALQGFEGSVGVSQVLGRL